jgi:hypothetical protein
MLDTLLEKGRNKDLIWVMQIDVNTGKVVDSRHIHCWGYMYSGVYTAYLATGNQRYGRAVADAIESVVRNPQYLFDEKGAGLGWRANAYSDSIEGALVLLNRVSSRAAEDAVDVAVRKMFEVQRDDGIVEDWHGDGNFIRTAMMYAFWKTQGTWLAPWNPRVHIGAVPEGDGVRLHVSAEWPWRGRIRFDHARHRDHWNMPQNYPRLNEFPEWFTVEQDQMYTVEFGEREARRYLGAELVDGIPLSLDAKQEISVRIAAEARTFKPSPR